MNDRLDPDEELPPPPPLRSFIEHTPVRIVGEAAVGATAGWLIAVAMALPEEIRAHVALMGGILAPIALLLTPPHGSIVMRAARYGGALAVLGTLVISFTGPGRERPVGELLTLGLILLAIGVVGHGLFLLVASRSDEGRGREDSFFE